MNAVLEKNMACLQKNYPHVYAVMEKHYNSDQKRKFNLMLVETKNSLPNVKVCDGEINLFLHSNYNPENEANFIFKTDSINQSDTFIILGFGMGYHIEKVLEAFPKKNKLVIEPDAEIFAFTIENRDITYILENKNNLELLIPEGVDHTTHELVNLYQLGRISNIEFIPLPSYQRLFIDDWNKLKEEFTKFLRTFTVNVRTAMVFKNAWIANFLSNLKHLPDSADLNDFVGQFDSVPAIIVSSGPSLNKNINLLKEVQDKALIISAGSSITALQKAGIKPHIMMGIDGGEDMARIYNEVEWNDILFTYVLNLHHRALDNYSGPKLYTKASSEHQVDWMERSVNHITPAITAGGSCANLCLDFIKRLGCNPVIFIGQDLAFTNLQTHAEGCVDRKSVNEDTIDFSKLKKVKDIYGEEIYTADIFMTMGYTFEGYIRRFPEEHLFINATEGGMNIKGTKVMTLREAIDQHCRKDLGVLEKINDLFQKSSKENQKLENKLIKFVNKIQKHSNRLKNLSEKRLKILEKININIKKNNLNITKQREKLFDLTKKFENDILFKEILEPSCRDFILVLKNNAESKAEDEENIKVKMKILFEGLEKQYLEVAEKNNVINIFAKEALKRLEDKEWENGE